MKVRAKKLGYFGGRRVREGDEFDCPQSQFSDKWMEKVKGDSKKAKEPVKEEEKATDVLNASTFSEITSLNK